MNRLWAPVSNKAHVLNGRPQQPVCPTGQVLRALPAMAHTGLGGILYKYVNILARVRYTQHLFIVQLDYGAEFLPSGERAGLVIHLNEFGMSRKVVSQLYL